MQEVTQLSAHPIADVFPMMTSDEHETLLGSMRDVGYDSSKPVTLYEGKILDGRNRYKAAAELGLEPVLRHWTDADGNPWEFVRRDNTARRDLDQGTKAACVLKLLEGSAVWENEHSVARGKVNEARSEAARAQPREGSGLFDTAGGLQFGTRPARADTNERVRLARLSGTSTTTAGRVLSLAHKHPEKFAAVARGEISAEKALGEVKLEAKRKLAEEIRSSPVVTPDGRYQVIVSDPPWKYDARAEDTTHRGKNQYPDMDVEEICALPVGKLAQKDCVLWLWTTNAFMREAYQCLDAWGFQAKTILTWDKERLGLGDWLRNVTEHCILAVKGKPVVSLTNQTTIIRAPRREHSRKPDEFYALVNALCPGSKLEMFARTNREGWSAWGAETEKFDASR
jgi:N6-adenosine-specific RNA methylase IME4